MSDVNDSDPGSIEIAEQDILAAMKDIQGYIDITPGDFREVFQVAFRHAVQRIKDSVQAGDIMTSPVHCVGLEMDLRQTAAFMADQRISGAPVVDAAGRIAGMVSEKDFLSRMGLGPSASFMQIIARCLSNKGCMVTSLRNHAVRDIMTAPAITAGPEITMGEISALFIGRRINRLPIVDAGGVIIGIVTRTDLVRSYHATR
ncbi:MAG: CBS domain-containing protein [Desulfurivibrio sp.]|jgi:CBS domain-containing protein|nr:MAG: CBS domain-containing protein [Desulfurivibrio sp.]